MKKQLLILGVGLISSLSTYAQLSSPYTGAQPPAEVDQTADFYLYNVKSGRWFESNRNHAGVGFSTRGELGETGMDCGIKCLATDAFGNSYQIDPKFGHNNSLNSSNLYLDTGDAVTRWILEPADDSGIQNAFRIVADNGDYPYLYGNADGWLTCDGSADDEQNVWQLVTREERIQHMVANATPEQPADATWLIANPDQARENARNGQWIVSCSHEGQINDGNKHGPVTALGGDSGSLPGSVREFWSTGKASMQHTIKSIPNGTYQFGVQGYYRQGSADQAKDYNEGELFAYDRYVNGTEDHYATYFANSVSGTLMSIFEYAKDAREDGFEYNAKMLDPEFGDLLESGKWVPNSTGQAGLAFFNYPDQYQNPLLKVSVADGNLTIGIKKEVGVNDDWIIVDNFRLLYCGSAIDLDEVKSALVDAISAAEKCEARSTEALNNKFDQALANGRTVLESSTSAQEIAAAATAINEAVQLLTTTENDAKTLIATVALCEKEGVAGDAFTSAQNISVNGVTAEEIKGAIEPLRLARRLHFAETAEDQFAGATPEAGKKIYLYNVGQKRFFCGGEDWGAHAALGFPGIEILLESVDGQDGFKIDTRLQNGPGQHYLNYGGYCDCTTDDTWKFVEVSAGVYNIVRTNDETLMLGYRPGRYATVDSDMSDGTLADNQWKIVSREDRDLLLENATEENPVDASHFIKMPNFNQREYEISGGWDNTEGEEYAWEHMNGNIWGRGGNQQGHHCFECYNQDPLVLTQTVENLYPGYYILSVQGYYRDCAEGDYVNNILAGGYEPARLAKLTGINENDELFETELVTIDTEANAIPGYGWNSNTEFGRMPNDPGQASNYFQVGKYNNQVLVEVGNMGTLTIEVSKNGGLERDWVCVDNFRLTYLGEAVPTGIDGITENETVKDGKTYNLQGVQVKDATQRGIYIRDGKKFVVK